MKELIQKKIEGHEKVLGELAVKKEEIVNTLKQLKEQFDKTQAGLAELERIAFSRKSAIAALVELTEGNTDADRTAEEGD